MGKVWNFGGTDWWKCGSSAGELSHPLLDTASIADQLWMTIQAWKNTRWWFTINTRHVSANHLHSLTASQNSHATCQEDWRPGRLATGPYKQPTTGTILGLYPQPRHIHVTSTWHPRDIRISQGGLVDPRETLEATEPATVSTLGRHRKGLSDLALQTGSAYSIL